jgi:hypothetical protein
MASCVFLLDYDELQKGDPASSVGGALGESGAPGAGAGADAGAAGAAGSGFASCGDCDDQDACTIDTCDETGDTPECLHEPTVGLKLDGFDVSLPAEHHARVSLVASGKLFYFATLLVNETTPQIALYRLASDGTELEPLGAETKLEGTPVSNVGLAVEELALGEVVLHGFLAAKPKLGDLPAKVFHLVNQGDKTMTNLVGTSYLEGNETLFPQALNIAGTIEGAWIQADHTMAVHDVGSARTDIFGAASVPATTLSLLSTADDKPAVLFTAQASSGNAVGTYVETAGQNRARLAECETRAGDYLSSSVISTQIPGVWLTNVTRYGADYLTTGGGAVACSKGTCTPLPEDCSKATPSNGLRNVSGATLHFPTDDPGIVYSVAAIPQVTTRDDDPSVAEGRLSLALGRVDFSTPGKAESTSIGGDPDTGLLRIAHNDTSEASGFAGPDWPAVGILPTEQVAVAWIQPNATADGSELHVQRYKMCLP